MLAKKVSNNHSSKVVTLRIPTQAGNSQQSQSRSVQDDHQAVDIDSFESSQFQQDPDTLLVANSKPKSILTAILAGLTFSLSLIVAYTWMQKYISPAPTPATTQQTANSDSPKSTTQSSSRASQRQIEAPSRYQLQEMALNIMQDSDWDLLKVHYFGLGWQKMPREEQLAARDSIWFQLFEDSLSQEINKYLNHPDSSEQTLTTRIDSLTALTDKLRTLNPPTNKSIARKQPSADRIENATKRIKAPLSLSSATKADHKTQNKPAQQITRGTNDSRTTIKTPPKKAAKIAKIEKNQLISRPKAIQESNPKVLPKNSDNLLG